MANLTVLAADLASPAAEQAKDTGKSVSKAFQHNAKSQAVNLRGTPDEVPRSSLFFNPAKTQESEKWDILQAFLLRGRAAMSLLSSVVLDNWVVLESIPKLVSNVTAASAAPMALKVKDILSSAAVANSEIGAARILLKDMIANGFELKRLAEPMAFLSKAFFIKAETVAQIEAPVVVTTGSAVNTNAVVLAEVADLKISAVREEIHRIANVYGIEAGFLTALIQATAMIKAGEVQIDSLGQININSQLGVNIKAVGPISLESVSTVDIKGSAVKIQGVGALDLAAGAAISAQAGAALNLHGVASATMSSMGISAVTGSVGCLPWGGIPVPPVRADLIASSVIPVIPPLPFAPILPVTPDTTLREPEMVEQTQGMTTLGGTVL